MIVKHLSIRCMLLSQKSYLWDTGWIGVATDGNGLPKEGAQLFKFHGRYFEYELYPKWKIYFFFEKGN